jgi:hypothetical protein
MKMNSIFYQLADSPGKSTDHQMCTSEYVALLHKPALHYSRTPERIGRGIMLIFKYNFPVV